MGRSATEVHARLKAAMHAAEADAKRINQQSVDRALGALAGGDLIDQVSLAFLRRAHRSVLAMTAALGSVIDTHQGLSDIYGDIGCRECGTLESEPCRTLRRVADCLALYAVGCRTTVDAAEVWRRADSHVNSQDGPRYLLDIREFDDGFIARPVWVTLPDPPAIPDPGTEQVLIIDKVSGVLTVWPLMTLSETAIQYRRYKKGEPMTFDDLSGG